LTLSSEGRGKRRCAYQREQRIIAPGAAVDKPLASCSAARAADVLCAGSQIAEFCQAFPAPANRV
jgi:hypothetical protein